MKKDQKVAIVEQFAGVFTDPGVYLMDFKGLNVAHISQLRNILRESKISMKVIKNTLATRALKRVGVTNMDEFFVGPTGVVWSEEDSVTPARVLLDFIKKSNKGSIKAGIVDGAVFGAMDIERISKLPNKHELRAKLASTLNAPLVKLAVVLNALPTKFVRTVDALKEKKEGDAA